MRIFMLCAIVVVNATGLSADDVGLQPKDGRKLFGFNTSQLAFTYGNGGFSYLSDQLDLMAKYGANVVRVMGEPSYVSTGIYTQKQYEEQWLQVAAYCAKKKIFLYPCFECLGEPWPTRDQWADVVAGVLIALEPHQAWIIGCDFKQEANFSLKHYSVDDVHYIYGKIKATIATAKKKVPYGLTVSVSETLAAQTALDSLIKSCDFLDVHQYANVAAKPTPQLVNALLARYPNKQFIMGEFGSSRGDGPKFDWIDACVATCMDTAQPNATRNRGGMHWAFRSYDPTPGNDWGATDTKLVPREDMLQHLFPGKAKP